MTSLLFSYIICISVASLCSIRVHSRIIYVTPGDKSICPKGASPCQTLNWYNQNSNGSFMTNNTEVRFLNGTHVLKTTVATISNRYNLTITGFESTSNSHDSDDKLRPISIIDCKESTLTGFRFINSREIHIRNIGFESCGAKVKVCHHEFNAALYFKKGSNIILHRIVVNNTRGYGLHTDNVLDSIQINESSFMRAVATKPKQFVGNARFWFGEKYERKHTKLKTNLTISSSQFLDGKESSTGLEVIIDSPNVYVVIENVTIRNNRGKNGGNLVLSVTEFGQSMGTSLIKIRNCHIDHGRAYEGGGMRFQLRTKPSNISTCKAAYFYKILEVNNTIFQSNFADSTGGAVYMMHYQSAGYNCVVKRVKFLNCTFIENFGNGAVMEISKHLILAEHGSPPLNVSFEDCQFFNNYVPSEQKGQILNVYMGLIVVSNCVFTGSNGTAISLRKSKLNIYSSVRFENNHAEYGGALKVCEGSFVFLHNNSHIRFINNTAVMGGAVFIQEACLDTSPPCVFQPSMPGKVSVNELQKYIKVDFVNNSASIAGDSLYGGSIEICYTIAKYSYDKKNSSFVSFIDIFEKIFNMEHQTGPSWIASDPKGVCFCNINKTVHQYFCQEDHPVIEVYPGESFNISAVTVGQLNGVTLGSLKSSLKDSADFHWLVVYDGEKYTNHCVPLNYTLYTNKTNATVFLRPSVQNYDKAYSVNVTIRLLPCPLGFELATDSNGHYSCKCSRAFQQLNRYPWYTVSVICDINTQTIHVPKESTPVWIGCHLWDSKFNIFNPNNHSICDVLLLSQSCDYYCSLSDRNVSIFNLDEQCIKGRTGILCGACRPGLSRTIGRYLNCKECSDTSLVKYITAILLSGVLLVFVITILNITVTEGTINGLVLYATVLFRTPSIHQRKVMLREPLWKFIAWINLESGFNDACAYNGLTGYQYIWLNFGYVFYLLLIQIIIILLSRRFVFFTRLIGKNVVKVLATLQFITYSQLMYTIFHTFHFAVYYESTPNGQSSVKKVWNYDGNIKFLGLKHTLLFLVAVICSLVTVFFVFCLLFIQCLQKRSGHRFLHWVERMRPFFEAYTGPCNDNYRFWPGLMYVIRTIMYGVSMYVDSAETHWRVVKLSVVAAFCILMMSLACIFPHGVYKKWPLNLLEFSFLLNLCVLCILFGSNRHKGLTEASVTLVMIVSFGIILYHIYQQMKGTRVCIKLARCFSVCTRKIRKRKNFKESAEHEPLLHQPLPTVVQFREPLLDD